MVRLEGLEPSRAYAHHPLKMACLPFHHNRMELLLNGASGQNRTVDTRIFSPLLYRLSYRGKYFLRQKKWRPRSDLNWRSSPWQGDMLTATPRGRIRYFVIIGVSVTIVKQLFEKFLHTFDCIITFAALSNENYSTIFKSTLSSINLIFYFNLIKLFKRL